jgi:hypothetical protein
VLVFNCNAIAPAPPDVVNKYSCRVQNSELRTRPIRAAFLCIVGADPAAMTKVQSKPKVQEGHGFVKMSCPMFNSMERMICMSLHSTRTAPHVMAMT